jgi:hypothetical protein
MSLASTALANPLISNEIEAAESRFEMFASFGVGGVVIYVVVVASTGQG